MQCVIEKHLQPSPPSCFTQQKEHSEGFLTAYSRSFYCILAQLFTPMSGNSKPVLASAASHLSTFAFMSSFLFSVFFILQLEVTLLHCFRKLPERASNPSMLHPPSSSIMLVYRVHRIMKRCKAVDDLDQEKLSSLGLLALKTFLSSLFHSTGLLLALLSLHENSSTTGELT